MRAIIILLTALFFLCGCSDKKAVIKPAPDVTLNNFTDYNYPCVSVTFERPVEYDGAYRSETIEGKIVKDFAVYHILRMPSKSYYRITVVKKHTADSSYGWTFEPLDRQYGSENLLYSIQDMYDDGKSGVIALVEDNGDIVMRSVVAYLVGTSDLFMVITDRTVCYKEYKHTFITENWKVSTAGKKMIAEMVLTTEHIFNNSRQTDCRQVRRLDEGVITK